MPKQQDDIFEVDKILAERKRRSISQYLVRWKGYGDEECTWEPIESFNNAETITTWHKRKARGDVLGAQEVKILQDRIDAFQSGASSSSASQVKEVSSSQRLKATRTPTNPRRSLRSSSDSVDSESNVSAVDSLPHPSISRKEQRQQTPSILKPRKNDSALSGKSQKASLRAGTKFRSLAHRNNYRKNIREAADLESPPTPGLLTPSELPAIDDTVHILPPGSPPPTCTGHGSWLFFSDDPSATSPTKSPRPLSSSPTPHQDPGADQIEHGSAMASLNTTDQHTHEAGCSSPSTDKGEKKAQGGNGRVWERGDIFVRLSMDNPIGDVKLVHLPWFPVGKQILAFKTAGLALEMNIPSDNMLKREEFELFFSKADAQTKAYGLVEPFDDTEEIVNEFTQYLTQYDSAAWWPGPEHNDISLLFFTHEAPSWQDLPSCQSRAGRPASTLHFAVIYKKLYPRSQHSGLNCSADTDTVDKDTTASQAQSDHPVSSPEAADMPHEELGRIQNSPATESGLAPVLRQGSPSSSIEDSSVNHNTSLYEKCLEEIGCDTSRPTIGLQFHELLPHSSCNDDVDRSVVLFYITFTKSHPLEAALMRKWLQIHINANQIYDDAQPDSWEEIYHKAKNTSVVVLFHSDGRRYHSLTGLGEMLNVNHVQCFLLTFGEYFENTITPVSVLSLFPEGSVLLITEENIVVHPQVALTVLRFFLEEKRPGWKVVFRPQIRRWLRHVAAGRHEGREQDELYDILIMVEGLIDRGHTQLELFDVDNDTSDLEDFGSNSSSFLISPSSLPEYDDSSSEIDAIRKRDIALIDYFCGFAEMMAPRYRRFWMFHNDKAVPHSGHVFIEDPHRFVQINSDNVCHDDSATPRRAALNRSI